MNEKNCENFGILRLKCTVEKISNFLDMKKCCPRRDSWENWNFQKNWKFSKNWNFQKIGIFKKNMNIQKNGNFQKSEFSKTDF